MECLLQRGLKSCLAFACVIVTFLIPCPVTAEDFGWTKIFNGENLDGWYTYLQGHGRNSDPERIVTIEDGTIHLYKNSKHGDQVVMGYIGTIAEHSDYHLRVEYKWGEKKFEPRFKLLQDAGIYYHMVGEDMVWPRALQFQVEATNVGDIVTVGNIQYDTTVDPETKEDNKPTFMLPADGGIPHTHGLSGISYLARRELHEKPGWNVIEVIARGDRAEHRLNGHLLCQLEKARQPNPDSKGEFVPLTQGRILLEIEAAEMFFRNIDIKLLNPL